MKNTNNILSAIDDDGNPVDWWFLYKIAGKSIVSDGSKATGNEYVYFDSTDAAGKKLALSGNHIGDAANGAVSHTLNQIYNNLDNPDLGWFFYNDEDPITGKTNSVLGHTKGVLCFNLATDSAFWMIHSAPKFSPQDKYAFPETATGIARREAVIDALAPVVIAAQQANNAPLAK